MGEEGKFVSEWWNSRDGYGVNCSKNNDCNELNDGCLSDSDDDLNWGGCDGEIRCLFDQVLRVLFRGKNEIRPIPALLGNGLSVDLFKLFCLVRDRGGFGLVSKDRLWGLITEKLGFDVELSGSIKLIYYKYLDELDQWLNRITRDRVSCNGSYECGGSLGSLSYELERRLSEFRTNRKGFGPKDEYDEICKDIDKGSEVNDGVVVVSSDDDDKLYDSEEFVGKENICDVNQDIGSRKRKRDVIVEMLSWMNKIAKNPRDPPIGVMPRFSKGEENWCKDVWSVALSLREARLHKRNADLNNDQSSFQQKKQKAHPSMYEDVSLPSHNTPEGVRCSKRILSLVKSSSTSHRCSSFLVDHRNTESPCKDTPENRQKPQDPVNTDSPTTKNTPNSSIDDPPFEKHVLIGPEFQVEVPIWLGVVSESDPKWLGTQLWSPDTKVEKSCSEFDQPGKGRADCCNCSFPGSVECYRFHIAERRMKLRRELGLVFYHWKFDRMGEEISLSWSSEEETIFKQMIRSNRLSFGKSFFPKKTRTELVSYYYNVFQIKRRSYQNRVTPKEIDSDDDEADFGLVSKPFGYRSFKIPETKLGTCSLNEQVSNLD